MLRVLAFLPLLRGLFVLLALAVGLAAVHSLDVASPIETAFSAEGSDHHGHDHDDDSSTAPLHNPFEHTHVTLGLPAPPPTIFPPPSSRLVSLRRDPAARSEPRQFDRPPRPLFVA